MSSHLLLAWVVTWSFVLTLGSQAQTTTYPLECNEPITSECQCGESGRYQDVYVSSCQVYTEENATRCEACPGSCGAYKLCKTCSKDGCLSCPIGRWGRFCENAKNPEAKIINYPEASEDFYVPETENIEGNFEVFPEISGPKLLSKNISPEKLSKSWKYNGKHRKAKYYRDPITAIDAETTAVINGGNEQPYNDMEKAHYADVFPSNDNPEVSHLLSSKTEKLTSIQKSKETLTVLQQSLRENDKDEFRSLAMKQENETDNGDDRLINTNGSFIYKIDSVNSPMSDVLNFRSVNNNFSEIIDLKVDNFEERGKGNSDEKLNSSSSHSNYSNMPFLRFNSPDGHDIDNMQEKKLNSSSSHWRFPEVHESANSEKGENFNISSSHWKFAYESPEVHESGNSDKDQNFNNSFNHWKFAYESPEVHESANSEKDQNYNNSSNHWKFPYGSPQINGKENFEANENLNGSSSQWKFPFEFPEVQESANSEENVKVNSSSRYWKFPFESSEVEESPNLEKHESSGQILEPKNQAETGQFFEKEFDFEDIKLPSFSLFNEKDILKASEAEESAKTSVNDKNTEINPMRYRLAFAFSQSSHKEENISQIQSNKQSNSSEIFSESPELQNPLDISIFKMKIVDTEGDVSNLDTEFTNASREQVDVVKITNSSEMFGDQISKLSENNSKEFDIVSPLEVNIFKIKFLGEVNDSPNNSHNSNIPEKRLTENGEKSNNTRILQKEKSELPENTATEFKEATLQNSSISRLLVLKENTNSSSEEPNKNITIQRFEGKKGENTKEKRVYHKRNATNRPHGEPQYDLDVLQKMIMQLPELTTNKAKISDEESLSSSHSFSKSNIPDNHILMPLYFPDIYNAEYQSNFLHNSQPHKICDLFPNYSPCFRVRLILPGSPYNDLFGSPSRIQSKHHQHKDHSHYHSEGEMGMRSGAENGQNRLTDSQILTLIKQYFQSKNDESTSSTPLQHSQALEDIFHSTLSKNPQYLTQGWNKEERSKGGFGSILLSGLINYFLSFLFPKYGGAEQPTQSAVLHQKEHHQIKPGPSVASNEIIEFSLDVNEPLQARSFPNGYGYRFSRPFDIPKAGQSQEKNCSEESSGFIQKDNATAETLPETADSVQIKILRPMFGEMSYGNDIVKRERLNYLESEEDSFFEPCAWCVYTESVYEDAGGEEKKERALPTIFRALIVEEDGLQFENKSDSEKHNDSRSKRSMYSYGTQSWCPIVRQMLNGDLDCTIWSYQKVCALICHPGYRCKYNTFTCSRQTNTWEPNLQACEPMSQYRGFLYRHGNESYIEDVFNYLPDRNEPFENVGNYYYPPVNNSYLFDNMGVNNREANFPNYEPSALQWDDDNRDMPFEIKGNSEFDQNDRLSNNATLDVIVNPKFPIKSYSSNVAQDGRNNGNYEFGNIQGFHGDSIADRTNNSKFDNIQGFAGYKKTDGKNNSTFDDIQRFPGDMAADRTRNSKYDNSQGYSGVEILDRKDNSTYDIIQGFRGDKTAGRKENSSTGNRQGFPGVLNGKDNSKYAIAQSLTGDKKDNSSFYDDQEVPVEVAQYEKSISTINKTRDFPDFVLIGGKDIDKKMASLDEIRKAEKIFDMYEKKRPTPKSSSYKKLESVEQKPPVEESDEQLDTIYSFFEKENPEPGSDDSESSE